MVIIIKFQSILAIVFHFFPLRFPVVMYFYAYVTLDALVLYTHPLLCF